MKIQFGGPFHDLRIKITNTRNVGATSGMRIAENVKLHSLEILAVGIDTFEVPFCYVFADVSPSGRWNWDLKWFMYGEKSLFDILVEKEIVDAVGQKEWIENNKKIIENSI